MRSIDKLALFNQDGRLNPKKSFAPFGIQPSKGSYCVVGSRAFLHPDVRKVRVGIAWDNLPPSFRLADHYAGYPGPITSSSFKVAASYLTGGHWQPLNMLDNILFNREMRHGLASQFDVELPERFTTTEELREETEDLNFDHNSAESFLQFALIEPEFGFGYNVYSQLLSAAVLGDAQTAVEHAISIKPEGLLDGLLPDDAKVAVAHPPSLPPLPNPPFTPWAARVTVWFSP